MLARDSRILQSLGSTLLFRARPRLLQTEDDGSDDLEAPSPNALKAIRKHSNRRHGIYGGLVKRDV